jgi:acetyl-CoA synthetase
VDEIKGRVPEVYISLKPGVLLAKAVIGQGHVDDRNHDWQNRPPEAKIHIVPDMPKTRSGKIMRRVLAAISNHMDTGDITTLANPGVVMEIREQVQGKEPM